VTGPSPERNREQRETDAGWDDAILVWNGMTTTAARSNGAASETGADVVETRGGWRPEMLATGRRRSRDACGA
jgi:hypothetical protein